MISRIIGVIFFLFLTNAEASSKLIESSTLISVERSELKTFVYLSEKNVGTLLIRSPYLGLESYEHHIKFWNARGFNVVLQSTIGTGDSTGDFKYLSTDEIQDGKKTIEWIEKQAFFNGNLILFGESYDGFLALAAALNNKKSVKAIIAASAPTNILTDSFTAGGMVEHRTLKYYLDVSSNQTMSPHHFERKVSALYRDKYEISFYDHFFKKNQDIIDWESLVKESLELNFINRGIYERLHQIQTPILLMAGELADQDVTDALHTFFKRKKDLKNSTLHCATKLAVGEWFHSVQTKLSRSIVSEFVDQVLKSELDCEFQHQIEYFPSYKTDLKDRELGENLSEIFEYFNSSFNFTDVQYGLNYEPGSNSVPYFDNHSILPLASICEPWSHVSVGLERPFVEVPIEKDLKLVGSFSAELKLISGKSGFVDLSLELLVQKQGGGWSTLDDPYNMHRSRRRVFLKSFEPTKIEIQTPFLSLELKKGDRLIVSFQRSHNAITSCSPKRLSWLLDKDSPLSVSFYYR